MAKEIDLTQGKKAIVDDEDFEWLNQWKWCYNNGYAVRNSPKVNSKSKIIFMHRLIANTPDGMETDHIDGNKLNNQRANLRVCTTSQNQQNRGIRTSNKSGLKGVSWIKRDKKWLASIRVGGKGLNLGHFVDPQEAARAYDKAARELHGEFAVLNNV